MNTMFRMIIRPTLILAVIAFLATLALSHVNRITRTRIDERNRQLKEEALLTVLPVEKGYVITGKNIKAVVEGKNFYYTVAEKTVELITTKAFAFETATPGYSGLIKSMVSVDESWKIIAISIIQQSETPGLGARVKEVASSETFFSHFFNKPERLKSKSDEKLRSWFEEQFSGLDTSRTISIMKKGEWRADNATLAKELMEANSVSAITGATITTKAVIDGISKSLVLLKKALDHVDGQEARRGETKQ